VASINFQPQASALPAGYLPDHGQLYDAGRGYGWSTPLPSRERGAVQPQVLDTFVFSAAAAVWELDLPVGWYHVRLAVGDALWAQGPQRVTLEDAIVLDAAATAAGQFLEVDALVEVEDGGLSVGIGGAGGNTALDQLVVAAAAPDVDEDGVWNDGDNCVSDANPGQADADDDGAGDACDADDDADGTEDTLDNCPAVVNPDQADADGDGTGDACEIDDDADGIEDTFDNCPGVVNPDQADADGDGGGDLCDVCPELAEAVQADADGDGAGDACDACPSDAMNDADVDGYCADADNCPDVANDTQADWDGDGEGDACDVLRLSFQPQTSPVPSGFLVDWGAKFHGARGWGWDLPVPTRDRLTSLPVELDTFVFTTPVRRWQIEVPNGDWLVRVVSGDPLFAQGPHRVRAGDEVLIDDAVTSASELIEGEATVEVRDGRIELEAGGTGGPTLVNLLEARLVDSSPVVASVNFQPSTSAVPARYVADSGDVYDAGRGHGWDVALPSRERGAHVPQTLDTFVFSALPTTWELDLPPGSYRVRLAVGDPSSAQGPHWVELEGSVVLGGVPTAAGQFLEVDAVVEVLDGRLSVGIGGAGGNTALNQLVVSVEAD
jgi:hypothetical protein